MASEPLVIGLSHQVGGFPAIFLSSSSGNFSWMEHKHILDMLVPATRSLDVPHWLAVVELHQCRFIYPIISTANHYKYIYIYGYVFSPCQLRNAHGFSQPGINPLPLTLSGSQVGTSQQRCHPGNSPSQTLKFGYQMVSDGIRNQKKKNDQNLSWQKLTWRKSCLA
jgi:hypothetical protein